MGNSESTADPQETSIDDFDGVETLGYRVLGVQPNSPASTAGLVSFFDFLIGADNQMLLGSGEDLQEGEEYDDVDFPALLDKFKNKPLQLLVWNIKCQQQRLVDIIPRDDWEGAGLLGVTIRLDNYAGAEDRLIRILSVEHNSPAAIAGLVSSQDYLLGTTTHSFDSTKVLAAVLAAHVDKVVELYVYNTNSDKVRVVALMPTWSWGGNGLLGAEVGTGYLHRLPGSCRSTLGGSVERRVRWIGGNKNAPQTPAASSNKSTMNMTSSPQQQPFLQQAPTLELEPQLEMEQPDDDEEENDNHHHPREESSMGTVSLASQVSAAVDAAGGSLELSSAPTTDVAAAAAAPVQQLSSQPEAEPNATTTINGNSTPPDASTTNGVGPGVSGACTTIKDEAPTSGGSGVFIPAPKALQNLPPTEIAGAPAPFPMTASNTAAKSPNSGGVAGGIMPTDPATQPITVTTFIPGPKPPPLTETISAEDLFSGPPPVAKIPTTTSVVINSPVNVVSAAAPPSTPDHNNNNSQAMTSTAAGSTEAAGTPATVTMNGESTSFSTPHPPSAVRDASATSSDGVAVPLTPPVPLYGNGIDDIMPPPPKMSGAQ